MTIDEVDYPSYSKLPLYTNSDILNHQLLNQMIIWELTERWQIAFILIILLLTQFPIHFKCKPLCLYLNYFLFYKYKLTFLPIIIIIKSINCSPIASQIGKSFIRGDAHPLSIGLREACLDMGPHESHLLTLATIERIWEGLRRLYPSINRKEFLEESTENHLWSSRMSRRAPGRGRETIGATCWLRGSAALIISTIGKAAGGWRVVRPSRRL